MDRGRSLNSRRLTRPEHFEPSEADSWLERLERLLDELAIQPGEDFVIHAGAPPKKLAEEQSETLGPFQRHSETSRKAAVDNYPRKGSQRLKVLQYIAQQGPHGATREEIAKALEMTESSVRPRVVELMEGWFVKDSGRVRKTEHRSDAEVLVATEAAYEKPIPESPTTLFGNS